ncbi:hypothetical protein ACNOYE_10940 [Nannocystaceae bacterium ST9]
MPLRLGVLLDDLALNGAKLDDPIDVVVIRSTFLNPPRAAAAKRQAEKIRELHREAELIPYAWHYVTHEADDGIEVGSNRALETTGKYGHFRSTPDVAQAWQISTICAEAFGSDKLIVRTPPSFSPGALSRKRLTEFAEAHPNLRLIWEPTGLWSIEAAVAFAEPLGIEVLGPAIGMTGQVLDFEDARWLRVPGGKDGRLRGSQAESLAVELAELGMFEEPEEADANANEAEGDVEPDDDVADDTITLLFDGPRAHANLRAFDRARELV